MIFAIILLVVIALIMIIIAPVVVIVGFRRQMKELKKALAPENKGQQADKENSTPEDVISLGNKL